MNDQIGDAVAGLMRELLEGASPRGGFVLNGGDPGLFASLDRLSAEAASATPTGSASIASHVDHLRYGLSLLNRWAAGENPFKDADWTTSWRKTAVTEDEWGALRKDFRQVAESWIEAITKPRDLGDVELKGTLGSVAHLAYHVGAIRQMDRAARGPKAEDSA